MKPRIILHLDMDAFFAAIEQRDNPEYRGKPVIVGSDPKKGKGRGVVSTCSYEARKFGIHSAMPISQAYRLCPHGIYVHTRGAQYARVSKQIMKILGSYSPDMQPLSIDEAFLDISNTYKFYKTPRDTAIALKKQIYDETQLTASVGIAPSMFLAKIASDLEKPNGLVVVEEDKVMEFLSPLDISKLWGVGKKTLPHMQKMGIRTIGDLAQHSQQEIIKKFGKSGLHFWQLANGKDNRQIESYTAAKSISKEITFEHDQDDENKLIQTLLFICTELCREMRRKQLWGKTVTMKIRLSDFSTFTRSRSFSMVISSTNELFDQIKDMFYSFERTSKVRLLGVSLSHLEKNEKQMDLFEKIKQSDKQIDSVLDKVREKFGEQSITRASLLQTRYDSQWIRD